MGMCSRSYRDRREIAGRTPDVLHTVCDFGPLAAEHLAAAERSSRRAADTEQIRLCREAGLSAPGLGEQLAAIAKKVGAALSRSRWRWRAIYR